MIKTNKDINNKIKGEINMSHRNYEKGEDYSRYGGAMAGLIIFILIVLQFQKRNRGSGNNQVFDNSVLFILVLFIIACCGKVKLGC